MEQPCWIIVFPQRRPVQEGLNNGGLCAPISWGNGRRLEKFKLVISEDGINLHSKHASTLVHIKGR